MHMKAQSSAKLHVTKELISADKSYLFIPTNKAKLDHGDE